MISLLLITLVAVKPRSFPAMGRRVMHTAATHIAVATKYSFIPIGENGLSSEHDIYTSSSLRPRWDEVPK